MFRLLFLAALGAAAHIVRRGASPLAREAAAQGEPPPLPFDVFGRALPNSPSGGYAPKAVDCPATRPAVRSASEGLSKAETEWLSVRRPATVKPMTDFLTRAGITGFDAAAYMSKVGSDVTALPNVAIAVSGGGYRALMNGGGFLMAADDRTPGATSKGGIGGLLQSATYLAGLSGGGWLLGSIYNNNFSSVASLRDGGKVWQFQDSILKGPDTSKNVFSSLLNTADYWLDIFKQCGDKRDAGFEVSLTDYWGRMLAYQLIDASDAGASYTWSSIAQTDSFKQGATPFPLIVADGRAPNTQIISLNSTVFEFSPYELGSWDPTENGFAPLEYIGSDFNNGVIPPNGKCIRGFDSSSFVMGTSSSLFNMILLTNLTTYAPDAPKQLLDAIKGVAEKIGKDNDDIAVYEPNPFFGYHNTTAGAIASSETLALVDGGEDLQNIPFPPVIQPQRRVDVVFAVDSSADTDQSWPNGTAMRATYGRSLTPLSNGTLFPAVPDADTFINSGLNNHPVFFGCDVKNFTLAQGATAPPLIVYIPNAPYTSKSNVGTFVLDYPLAQRNDILLNGYNAATQGNATLDAEWPACVACAVLQRSMLRTNTAIPAQCTSCFTRYCWDGKLNSTTAAAYNPAFKIADQSTYNEASSGVSLRSNRVLASVSLGVVAVAAMLL